MATYEYASQATKSMVKATPTVDGTGLVKKWDVEVIYSLNGYKSRFEDEILAGEFTPKLPSEFTKDELFSLCPHARWDMIYDSQYQSVVVAAPGDQKIEFDVNSLI